MKSIDSNRRERLRRQKALDAERYVAPLRRYFVHLIDRAREIVKPDCDDVEFESAIRQISWLTIEAFEAG